MRRRHLDSSGTALIPDWVLVGAGLLVVLVVFVDIGLTAQRHLAFPVIHYFHSSDTRTSIGPRLAALDEVLTLIDAVDLQANGLPQSSTRPLRQAISDYLESLEQVFVHPADEPPPPPEVAALRNDGIVGCSDEDLRQVCEGLAERRALLAGYLNHDGWAWRDIMETSDDAEEQDPED